MRRCLGFRLQRVEARALADPQHGRVGTEGRVDMKRGLDMGREQRGPELGGLGRGVGAVAHDHRDAVNTGERRHLLAADLVALDLPPDHHQGRRDFLAVLAGIGVLGVGGDGDLLGRLADERLDHELPMRRVEVARDIGGGHRLELFQLGHDLLRVEPALQDQGHHIGELAAERLADAVAADRHRPLVLRHQKRRDEPARMVPGRRRIVGTGRQHRGRDQRQRQEKPFHRSAAAFGKGSASLSGAALTNPSVAGRLTGVHTARRNTPMTPRQALRALVARGGYTMVPGAYDTLTARLVEQAGFAAVYLTGGGYSRASGYPDLGLLTLSENVRWIGLTVEAVGIPVIADADTGYGNAINVIRTVREYEKSGVAAFHLEDQVSPKKCGHYEGKEVIAPAEMIGKIKAAADTRRDRDLLIIARSDARQVEGLDAAIDRVNAYLEAGADIGFVEAPQTVDELRIIGRRVAGPALVNVFEGGKTPMLGANELEGMGFRLGIYPSQTHRAAIRAAQLVLRAMREDGDTSRVEADLATFQEREQAVGTEQWRALEDKYLRIGQR